MALSFKEAFEWGVIGFAAFEIWVAYSRSAPATRYQELWFWTTRILMAPIAGFVTVAYDPQSRLIALGIGFAAPVLPHLIGRLLASVPIQSPQAQMPPPRAPSPEIDIAKILDPLSQRTRTEEPAIPQSNDQHPAEQHHDQPVSH
jgi:hypothetical protein